MKPDIDMSQAVLPNTGTRIHVQPSPYLSARSPSPGHQENAMKEYLADLKPVSEWEFRLWRVEWRNNRSGQTKTLWLVSTEAHLHEECQRHWPGDYWHEYMEYDVCAAERPAQIGSVYGQRIDQDPWTAGEELRQRLGLA